MSNWCRNNSTLPYNQRAFSPQRIMNIDSFRSSGNSQSYSNYDQQYCQEQYQYSQPQHQYSQQPQYNQQQSWFQPEQSSNFNQPFSQLQTSSSRSDYCQQNRNNDMGIWDSSYPGSSSNYEYDFNQPTATSYNSQWSSSTSNYSNLNPQAFVDQIPSNYQSRSDSNAQNKLNSKPRSDSSSQKSRSSQYKSRDQKSSKSSKPLIAGLDQREKDRDFYPDLGNPRLKPAFKDVYEVVRQSDHGNNIYRCKICKVDTIAEHDTSLHLKGKKHKYNLKVLENSLPGNTRKSKMRQLKEILSHKRIIQHKSQFEEIIKTIKEPLVALEYVIEILNVNLKKPHYFCTLCNKKCDFRAIEHHLKGMNHKLNYLNEHFTPIASRLTAYRRFNEDYDFRKEVVDKICLIIESKCGRGTATIYEGTDFTEMQEEIHESIDSKKHITINDIPNAEIILLHGIDLDDLKWLSENPPKPPKITEYIGNDKKERKIPEVIINKYKSAVVLVTRAAELNLSRYQKDPDSHPQYKTEWRKFWKEKAEKLTKKGIDPSTMDFRDEWCDFFLRRIQELHNEDVAEKVDNVRIKLGLSKEEVDEITGRKKDIDEFPIENRLKVEVVDDSSDDDDDYHKDGPRISKDVLYIKEKETMDQFLGTFENNQAGRSSQSLSTRINSCYPLSLANNQPVKPKSAEPATLISTCRILTILEPEIGLLASKVINLMSKATTYERETRKSSNELLFDSENLTLIETVKEVIVGMQNENLITSSKETIASKAINDINELFEQHEMMVSIKKTLKDMGKDEASAEEIDMLKAMYMIKKIKEEGKRKRKRGPRVNRNRRLGIGIGAMKRKN